MIEEKGIQARILLDSLSPSGNRLTTWVLKYPRFIHAEFLTHRVFSRNSSSSRAIPVNKLIQKILDDPATPVWWGKNQRGMSAKEEFTGFKKLVIKKLWLLSRYPAVFVAWMFNKIGLHKQIANRIIEPWMHIEVVMSTTSLSNWFALRDHPAAQPEIAELARQMRKLYEESEPKHLHDGDWHLPFIQAHEQELPTDVLLKLSTARCARVSYLTHGGKRDVDKDIKLHDRLVVENPKHASPTEHQAIALSSKERWGNFVGWKQYRKMIQGESAPEEEYEHGSK